MRSESWNLEGKISMNIYDKGIKKWTQICFKASLQEANRFETLRGVFLDLILSALEQLFLLIMSSVGNCRQLWGTIHERKPTGNKFSERMPEMYIADLEISKVQ